MKTNVKSKSLIIAAACIFLGIASDMIIQTSESNAEKTGYAAALSRLEGEVSLPFSMLGNAAHFAEWQAIEEAGTDFIWRTQGFEGSIPKSFKLYGKPEKLPEGFPTSNLESLCLDSIRNDGYAVTDLEIRKLLCSETLLKDEVADWELYRRSAQDTILVAYFADDQILWVSKVRW